MGEIVTLVGVDPGIVDTGAVWVCIDKHRKTVQINSRVWRSVTTKRGLSIDVKERFLVDIKNYCKGVPPQHVFIEGFRNRGRNPQQDQKMTVLVQAIRHTLSGSTVVDNTGVKNVVSDELLKLLDMWDWADKTHHADTRSAARIMLKGAFQDDKLNGWFSDLIRGLLEGDGWTVTKSLAR